MCANRHYFKMKYSEYSKFVAFLEAGSNERKAMLRDLPQKDRYAFRRMALSFSLSNHTLYRFGKVALHDGNAASTLQDLHTIELEHQGGSVRLERSLSSRFYLKSIRAHCRAVSGACHGCKVLRTIMIDDGPMRHLSSSTRESLCRKFNLSMGNNPLPTEDSPTINLTTHKPITLECAHPNSSCFLDCIHYLLTGKSHKSTRLQAELIKQRRKQSSRYNSF